MGRRFCGLEQTLVEITLFRPRNGSVFSLKSGEDQKKRSLPQFGTIFGRNL